MSYLKNKYPTRSQVTRKKSSRKQHKNPKPRHLEFGEKSEPDLPILVKNPLCRDRLRLKRKTRVKLGKMKEKPISKLQLNPVVRLDRLQIPYKPLRRSKRIVERKQKQQDSNSEEETSDSETCVSSITISETTDPTSSKTGSPVPSSACQESEVTSSEKFVFTYPATESILSPLKSRVISNKSPIKPHEPSIKSSPTSKSRILPNKSRGQHSKSSLCSSNSPVPSHIPPVASRSTQYISTKDSVSSPNPNIEPSFDTNSTELYANPNSSVTGNIPSKEPVNSTFLGARLYIEYPTLLGVSHKRLFTLPFCSSASSLKVVCKREDTVCNYSKNDKLSERDKINLEDPHWQHLVKKIHATRKIITLDDDNDDDGEQESETIQSFNIYYTFPDDFLHPAAEIKQNYAANIPLSFHQVVELADVNKSLSLEQMEILMEFFSSTLGTGEIISLPPSYLNEYLDPMTGNIKWEVNTGLDLIKAGNQFVYPVKVEGNWQMIHVKSSAKLCHAYSVAQFSEELQLEILKEVIQVFSDNGEDGCSSPGTKSSVGFDPGTSSRRKRSSEEALEASEDEAQDKWLVFNHGVHPSQTGIEFSGPFAYQLVKYLVSPSTSLLSSKLRFTPTPARIRLIRALMNTNEESAIKESNHDDVALLQLLNHATRYELKADHDHRKYSDEEFTVAVPRRGARPFVKTEPKSQTDQICALVKQERKGEESSMESSSVYSSDDEDGNRNYPNPLYSP